MKNIKQKGVTWSGPHSQRATWSRTLNEPPIYFPDQFHSEFQYYSQFNRYRPDFFPWDLLQRNIIPTASLMFRNLDYSAFFEYFGYVSLSLNWVIHLYLIRYSKFRYFNEAWMVYNDHGHGVSKYVNHNEFKKTNIKVLKKLIKDDYYKNIKKDVFAAITSELYQMLMNKGSMKMPGREYSKLLIAYFMFSFRKVIHEICYFCKTYKREC
ncbi:MAG: hypothetical protein HY738_02280 [Bacteroidia bacterium]|nr:hypothetical protein [Bacteroidia bacterium]